MIHTGSYRENSNRVQKPFHLLLRYFKVAEMHPLFPMIPHSTARLKVINPAMALKSQDGVFSSKEGLTEALWRKPKQRTLKREEEKLRGESQSFRSATTLGNVRTQVG